MTTDENLRDLARDLPWEPPTASRRDALRSSLLVEAASSVRAPSRRWVGVGAAFTAGALAAAAVALLISRRAPTGIDHANLAQVTASSPEARIDHRVVATETGVDEIVHVRDGKLAISIPAQRRGDHVRIQTSTAEVEGDAGEIEVVVVREALQSVTVKTGTARVIVLGQAPVVLSAGQTWRASIITADLSPPPAAQPELDAQPSVAGESATTIAVAPVAPAPSRATTTIASAPVAPSRTTAPAVPSTTSTIAPVPPRVVAPTPDGTKPALVVEGPTPTIVEPVKLEPASIEQRFQAGWALLRAGKAREAATELGAAADAAPDAPLAADARYFQAVALVRANDPRAAERALVQFLDTAPKSLRRGRATVLLGRLLAERGDHKSARAWLESAAADPDPEIAAAAKAGLQALRR